MTAAVLVVLGALATSAVTGYVVAKTDIYFMEKRAEQRAMKRRADLDAACDEKGNISWSRFMEIQNRYR